MVVCETPGMGPSSPNPSLSWISGKRGAILGILQEYQGGLTFPRKPAWDTPGNAGSNRSPGKAGTGMDPGGKHRTWG